MEDITDAHYACAKKVNKNFEIKQEKIMIYIFKAIHYCQLKYLRTIEMCLKISKPDCEKFPSAPGLAQKSAIKKIKIKLYLLTDIDAING